MTERVFLVHKTPELTVYTLEFCPHCDTLKGYLKKEGYPFAERDLSTAESLTELRLNGVFVNEAPVLQRGEDFSTTADLFPGGDFDSAAVKRFLSGA